MLSLGHSNTLNHTFIKQLFCVAIDGDCNNDLSLKGEVSCKERGMCKLPQLENYVLSLMQKMKLSTGCFALNVMILVVSKSIFLHLADSTSSDCTDRCCGIHRIFS